MMIVMSVIGSLTLVFGLMMLFSFETLKRMNVAVSKVVMNEAWIISHRVALGILLLGLTVLIFTSVYFISKFGM